MAAQGILLSFIRGYTPPKVNTPAICIKTQERSICALLPFSYTVMGVELSKEELTYMREMPQSKPEEGMLSLMHLIIYSNLTYL